MGTDVAVPDAEQQALVAQSDAVAQEIAASQEDEYDDATYSTPILKVAQSLTREVQDGDAEVGEFINTLTNESLGDAVKFIVSFYSKGRFASDRKTNRAYVAFSQDIPDNWVDLVGRDYVGTAFAEHPESEEKFKEAVNNNEREWGHGPSISTTHNFTGLLVVEGEDDEVDYQPVRLSLKRTDVPAARKINTLHRMVLRNKPVWDAVLQLKTAKKESGGYTSYIIDPKDVKIVRPTSPTEKALGAELALAVRSGRTVSEGAEDALADRPAEPSAEGALAV